MKIQDRGSRIEDRGAGIAEEDVLTPQSSLYNPALLSRVRWRCRRGLLELDIVLGRFVDTHYMRLSEAERQIFEEFLDMADNPLWDLISGRQGSVSSQPAELLEKIKSL